MRNELEEKLGYSIPNELNELLKGFYGFNRAEMYGLLKTHQSTQEAKES